MTEQPIDPTARLWQQAKAAREFLQKWVNVDTKDLIALLETSDRYVALVTAVRAGHWNEAARLANEEQTSTEASDG